MQSFQRDINALTTRLFVENPMKYLFGPVNSRRLGISLGIDLFPEEKVCSMDCLYCECGPSKFKTDKIIDSPDPKIILDELKLFLTQEEMDLDYITFAGNGEPLLYNPIDQLIAGIKHISQTPICLLTNGYYLWDNEVRNKIKGCDLIIPSLDTVYQKTYEKLNRPVKGSQIQSIIDGIKQLKKEMNGTLWLEILLVKHINDTEEEIRGLKTVIKEIQPDNLYINTIYRPPAYGHFKPVSKAFLEKVREDLFQILSSTSDNIKEKEALIKERAKQISGEASLSDILRSIKRTISTRPLSENGIKEIYQLTEELFHQIQVQLELEEDIEKKFSGDEFYYIKKRNRISENQAINNS